MNFMLMLPTFLFFIMAQFSHLPVYIKTYEFIKTVYRIVKQFRKEYKYGLGAELQQIIWQILDAIIIANSLLDTQKSKQIDIVSELFDKFKIRFRFAYEMGIVPIKKFGVAQKEMEEIGKMIGGWQKWSANQKH
jgi:hypothetical protein